MPPSNGGPLLGDYPIECAVAPDIVHGTGRDLEGARGEFLTVLVPCHNEAATVSELLTRLRCALPDAEIVAIDDGSTDASVEIIEGLEDNLGLVVIRRERRGGKGAAVRDGLALATRPWVVIQDADLEYDPADLQRLAVTAVENPDCAVYGSRYLDRGKAPGGSLVNYLGVKFLAVLAYLLHGRYLTDPHTCYKMLPTAIARRLALESHGFELCAEINGKLLGQQVPILEIPASYQPRSASAGKKIGSRDFFRSARTYFQCHRERVVAPAGSTLSRGAYLSTRFLIGALLVVGGAVKLSPWREIALLDWLVLPAPVVFSIGVVEFILGCLVLSFAALSVIGVASRTVFTIYIALLLLQLWAGESVCNCLGSRSMPVLWMLILDSILLLAMWLLGRYWRQPLANTSRTTSNPFIELASATRYALPAVVLAGTVGFGSTDAAISYATGARLLAASSSQHIGRLDAGQWGTAAFELTNYSGQPVSILGAQSTCDCMALDDLPMTLAPGDSGEIRIRMKGRSGGSSQLQRESATLIFDDPARSLSLSVTASVLPPP